ncbi:hypothetical protein WG66_002361, partial [Moniliophthora roreri]
LFSTHHFGSLRTVTIHSWSLIFVNAVGTGQDKSRSSSEAWIRLMEITKKEE